MWKAIFWIAMLACCICSQSVSLGDVDGCHTVGCLIENPDTAINSYAQEDCPDACSVDGCVVDDCGRASINSDSCGTCVGQLLQTSLFPIKALLSSHGLDADFACRLDPLDLAPQMMGDFLTGRGTQAVFRDVFALPSQDLPVVDVVVGRGIKVADNNKAIPQDRAYFVYNYFDNAILVQPGQNAVKRETSTNRYTVGLERTIFNGRHSVEVRAPFSSERRLEDVDFNVEAGEFDNLSVIYKYLLPIDESDNGAAVAGVGFNIPTGGDLEGRVLNATYQIENDSLRVLPYIGVMAAEDTSFFQMFLQFDVVANGDSVVVTPDASGVTESLGQLNGQNYFYADISFGQWLLPHHFPSVCGLNGVAGIVELHYATTLQNSDRLARQVDATAVEFRSIANSLDILNFTGGLDFAFGQRLGIGIGAVLPLRRSDRSFDAQAIARVNYRF